MSVEDQYKSPPRLITGLISAITEPRKRSEGSDDMIGRRVGAGGL